MKITMSGKNMQISDTLRNMTEKKFRKLEKYFDADTPVDITMSVEKFRHNIEVTVILDGTVLRGEESTNDMYSSIDNVIDKLVRQMHRHRTRLERRLRAGAFVPSEIEEALTADSFEYQSALEPEEEGPRIVRTKRFAIKPMDEEEAIMQMELLGHSFFVFTNAISDEVNVLYRRKDGDYGLIEPDYT